MNKGTLTALIGSFFMYGASAQDTTVVIAQEMEVEARAKTADNGEIYKLNPKIDIPITVVGTAWSGFAFTKIYSKDPSTETKILEVMSKKDDINGFDRWAADVYSDKAASTSDIFFYGAMPLPFTLMLDKDIRQDAGKIGFLYLEAMAITGIFYTGSVYVVDRYRPLVYNTDKKPNGDPLVPMEEKTRGGSKNSFIAGHPALVATSTFFTAKVFSHYNPNSKLRPFFYGAAIVCTGGTAWLRHRGGKHFPSDLVIGTTIGTLSGLLVPNLHRNKAIPENLSITPFMGRYSTGMHLAYRF
jgi:membrane-associated phospholipid phosphatase